MTQLLADPIPTLVGVDVGTTHIKLLVTSLTGVEIADVATPTPWVGHDGFTDMPAEQLTDSVLQVLKRAVTDAKDAAGEIAVHAIAVTGMAEAGVLVDAAGATEHPVIAWFDPRGAQEVLLLPSALLKRFEGTTGLPVSALATIAKLAWMRGQGTDLRGKQWLGVPEYLVHRLGATRVAERSLIARTGLYDQTSEQAWPQALRALGAEPDFVPPIVAAGTPLGRVTDPALPQPVQGAVLTVAGHDHPVAAVGCGAVGDDDLFDSMGTAEALVRTITHNLDYDARKRLAAHGINALPHVMAGRYLLLAATKGGLVLRRCLEMLGADQDRARDALDHSAAELYGSTADHPRPAAPVVRVEGAANSDGILKIAVTADRITPSHVWLAAITHGADEAQKCLDLMTAEVGPASRAVIAGGWTNMQTIRTAKTAQFDHVRFSQRNQAGTYGATLFAAHAIRVIDKRLNGHLTSLPAGLDEAFARRYIAASLSSEQGDQSPS